MITKTNKYVLSILLIFTVCVQAETISIKLTQDDQSALANRFSKIDLNYRTEELFQESPYDWTRKIQARFLDEKFGLYIKCSQDFVRNAVVPTNGVCEVVFNYEQNEEGILEVHDGFMPLFAIAEIKDKSMAKILYGAISNGINMEKAFFQTREMLTFKHPTTGKNFSVFRLRIDCQRDAHFENYSCVVSAVK
ncbi:MAG: hypothetical protein A2381_18095 [Bdellovibrionales bacterium RIFOXYB1_FULL_37_110]|nr:MAG: hypothetical protein A2417_06560 [Bdellovibrionales bacterium RIFOXYC1_FULL_37_79]OFZ58585.1 MAG: hypothetical protein A2381_18095 [Bdellovibrionales bacterium RIFOXYB1_FULL_37_110]OFZ61753.1 MAG: hypothetical protein A2577_19595 [Bdellovibrionales bacterium RIFOXYD1_FULL_36_51]